MIRYLKDDKFLEAIAEGTVLVDFYADWCGPCKMMGTILETLDDLDILKVNTDEYQELAMKFGIMNIPTLMLFKEGMEVGKLIGLHSREEIEDFVKEVKWLGLKKAFFIV